jgi:hypothetical protein
MGMTEATLGRLAIVVDAAEREYVRMAALAAVVADLPAGHHYRLVPVERLYDLLVPAWATRKYLVAGRAVERQVARPPQTLSDILP